MYNLVLQKPLPDNSERRQVPEKATEVPDLQPNFHFKQVCRNLALPPIDKDRKKIVNVDGHVGSERQEDEEQGGEAPLQMLPVEEGLGRQHVRDHVGCLEEDARCEKF